MDAVTQPCAFDDQAPGAVSPESVWDVAACAAADALEADYNMLRLDLPLPLTPGEAFQIAVRAEADRSERFLRSC